MGTNFGLVSFFSGWLKLLLWDAYLVLNVLDGNPMYVFSPFAVIYVASYTTLLVLHLSGSGHSSLILQLHLS